MNKQLARTRRLKKTREHIKKLGIEKGIARLTLHRSNQHIYAQVIAPVGGKVLAAASSLEKSVSGESKDGGKVGVAKSVGKLIAERAKAAGIENVACDRSGFKYHGRIKALADAARENGLNF